MRRRGGWRWTVQHSITMYGIYARDGAATTMRFRNEIRCDVRPKRISNDLDERVGGEGGGGGGGGEGDHQLLANTGFLHAGFGRGSP